MLLLYFMHFICCIQFSATISLLLYSDAAEISSTDPQQPESSFLIHFKYLLFT